ncbi:GNAT family N-acetyltransferase [Rubritalea tangerina]|uniref:GNAT family N-acetyltransferase n=1 Tax=Rubritalea tangerina TaxID=430798 RepID=A0ABW4Z7V2_9BACT
MQIRSAQPLDAPSIHDLHLNAFPKEEAASVAQLACRLIKEPSTPASLHLVAEEAQQILAHVSFSPVFAKSSLDLLGYILAPLAVQPHNQKQGLGSQLIKQGIAQLTELSAPLLFVYGDPKYYCRFGFREQVAAQYLPAYPLNYPSGWLALPLADSNILPAPSPIRCVPALDAPNLW